MEVYINETYISDEECTMCHDGEEATMAMEIVFKCKDPIVETKNTVYFCPGCLDELPDEYFNLLEELDEIEAE